MQVRSVDNLFFQYQPQILAHWETILSYSLLHTGIEVQQYVRTDLSEQLSEGIGSEN